MKRREQIERMINKGKMMTSNSYVILRNAMNTDRNYSAYRFEGRRPAVCNHIGCGRLCERGDGSIKVITPFAPLGLTLCAFHAHNTDCYSLENDLFEGKVTKDGITISCELETSYNTSVSRAVLGMTKYGFHCVPTNDSSIDGYNDAIEWKTAVFNNLCAPIKLFGAVESLMCEGYLEMDGSCGSHLHTGLSNNEIDFRYLFDNIAEYWEAFGRVYAYLDGMPNEKMKQYFGRGFVGYARTLRKSDDDRYVLPRHDGNGKNTHSDRVLYADDNLYGNESFNCNQHYLAFNLQHSYSIEFRLAKFVNAAQYRKIAVVMHNVVIFLRDYYYRRIDRDLLGRAIEALFKEVYPY